ncbi:hypothetical protein ACQ4PT_043153 [Festuca glaucescens]
MRSSSAPASGSASQSQAPPIRRSSSGSPRRRSPLRIQLWDVVSPAYGRLAAPATVSDTVEGHARVSSPVAARSSRGRARTTSSPGGQGGARSSRPSQLAVRPQPGRRSRPSRPGAPTPCPSRPNPSGRGRACCAASWMRWWVALRPPTARRSARSAWWVDAIRMSHSHPHQDQVRHGLALHLVGVAVQCAWRASTDAEEVSQLTTRLMARGVEDLPWADAFRLVDKDKAVYQNRQHAEAIMAKGESRRPLLVKALLAQGRMDLPRPLQALHPTALLREALWMMSPVLADHQQQQQQQAVDLRPNHQQQQAVRGPNQRRHQQQVACRQTSPASTQGHSQLRGVTETHLYDMHGNGRISKVLDSEIGNVDCFIVSIGVEGSSPHRESVFWIK